ncbi:MAG: hypothetical protein QOE58_1040, partial [Actinomycetota bacterium]|nr:hypothetical protein [Actinomycetota bacterium]
GRQDLLDRYLEASAPVGEIESQLAGLQTGSAARQEAVERLRSAHEQLDVVLSDIRKVGGFAEFPRPGFPPAEELSRLPAPLVFLIPGFQQGAAIRVYGDGTLEPVALPDAAEDALSERVGAWRQAAARWDGSSRDGGAWAREVADMGRWLWTVAMDAVADLLSGADEAILVPCGDFVDLPLHAAWRSDGDGRRYLIDDMVVRYAPSLRAALDKGRRVSDVGATTLLTVVDETLTWAPGEVAAVASSFGEDKSKGLVKSATTRRELLAALPHVDVVHFACHGKADPINPLAGALFACRDAPVTLADISTQDLAATRLVTLSACESAVSDPRLINEVVNLATGFLEAGSVGAIGSLWTVNDQRTGALMERTYQHWKTEGLHPAQALAAAQREMRGGIDGEPIYWAPFVYMGA